MPEAASCVHVSTASGLTAPRLPIARIWAELGVWLCSRTKLVCVIWGGGLWIRHVLIPNCSNTERPYALNCDRWATRVLKKNKKTSVFYGKGPFLPITRNSGYRQCSTKHITKKLLSQQNPLVHNAATFILGNRNLQSPVPLWTRQCVFNPQTLKCEPVFLFETWVQKRTVGKTQHTQYMKPVVFQTLHKYSYLCMNARAWTFHSSAAVPKAHFETWRV